MKYVIKIDFYKRIWYINGQFHREDGPAVELTMDDVKYWYINGKLIKHT
jgi:hypothetical protein